MHILIKAFAISCLLGILPLQAQVPDFRLENLEGEWKEFGDLEGSQLTVIDFWATWCQPCVRAIPQLNELANEFEDQGVSFIGISVDGPRNQNKILPFVRSMDVKYPILRDMDNEVMADLNVTAVPTLIIYDTKGEQLYFHEGFRPGDEVLIKEHIEKFLAD